MCSLSGCATGSTKGSTTGSAVGSRGAVRWVFTTRSDGDLRVPPAQSSPVALQLYEQRITALAEGRRVSWLRQVHGAGVVDVPDPVTHCGTQADAQIIRTPHAAVAVFTADCAPVLMITDDGPVAVAVAHVGWRGLLGGVLEHTVAALRNGRHRSVSAYIGPCIGPECYEFGEGDLSMMVERCGPVARGVTRAGSPALDLRAACRAALALLDVGPDVEPDLGFDVTDAGCTACSGSKWFSHRARADVGRQALIAWIKS